MKSLSNIWSNTDFPYMCLKDEVRTKAFHKAINKVVKKGDIVIDVGAGSGILSFFAAAAGAKKVYSVEIDALLAMQLEKSIKANGFSDIIEVVNDDILNASLPANVDVVVAEIIDTGLIEELQVPVINNLRKRGIITLNTRLIPDHYKTFLQLVNTDNLYYGYQIFAPKHEWPFYKNLDSNWYQNKITSVSENIEIASINFSGGIINEKVDKKISFEVFTGEQANAIRISGIANLTHDLVCGPTNAFNGDKIIPINITRTEEKITYRISYRMGFGLHNFCIEKV